MGVRERGKEKLEIKEEKVRGGLKKWSQRAEGVLCCSFVLLAQWPSVNATHRGSLLERRGCVCDRMQDDACVCVCVRECVCVCSAFVARCKIEFVCMCLLLELCA